MEQRKRILHLCICLLPKPNRDLLEVFLVFLRQVASFSGDDTGNKMDMNNLATVIAPNILYGKAKDDKQQKIIGSAKDESFLAIDAVKMLMQHQDEMWIVSVLCSIVCHICTIIIGPTRCCRYSSV